MSPSPRWPCRRKRAHRSASERRVINFTKAVVNVLLLFVSTYAPAFLTVALLKLSPFEAIPVVIVISLATAMVLIYAVSRRDGRFAEFGFRFCGYRYMAAAIVLGAPLAWALTTLISRLGTPPEISLRPWMTVLYFIVGASIQEEIIFRGLLQTTFARRVPASFSFFGTSFSHAAVMIALLFGLIHLRVNPITAAAAFVLGLLSGELRYRSGSLVPPILVHAIFNVFSAIS